MSLNSGRTRLQGAEDVIVYPQLALGGGFSVVLQVANQTTEIWRGTGRLDRGQWQGSWTLNGVKQKITEQ